MNSYNLVSFFVFNEISEICEILKTITIVRYIPTYYLSSIFYDVKITVFELSLYKESQVVLDIVFIICS